MTTKTTRQASNRQGNFADAPLDVAGQVRHHLALATSAGSMVYQATEAMQKVQQQWTERAALRHQQLSDRLQDANSSADVLAIQASMMTSSLQEAALYWQDLSAAGLQVYTAMAELSRSTPTHGSIEPPVVNPAIHAWQTMFTAPFNGAFNAATHH